MSPFGKIVLLLLLLLVRSIVHFQPVVGSENDEHSHDDGVYEDDGKEGDDDLIAENPDYVYEESAEELADVAPETRTRTRTTAKPNATSTTGKDEDVKSMLGKALARSKQVAPSKLVKFAQRHRNAIFLTLAITAFHREITRLLGRFIFKSMKDPKTGHMVRRLHFPVRPTTVLKFIVFVEVIRRTQRSKTRSSRVIMIFTADLHPVTVTRLLSRVCLLLLLRYSCWEAAEILR